MLSPTQYKSFERRGEEIHELQSFFSKLKYSLLEIFPISDRMANIHPTPYLLLVLLSLVCGLLNAAIAASAKGANSRLSAAAPADRSDTSRDVSDVSTSEAAAPTRGRRTRVCQSSLSSYRACMRRSHQLKVDALQALQDFDVDRGLELVRQSRAIIADECALHERTLLTCCPALAAQNASSAAVREASPQAASQRPAAANSRRRSTQTLCVSARSDLQTLVSQMGRLNAQIDEAVNQVFAQMAELDADKAESA